MHSITRLLLLVLLGASLVVASPAIAIRRDLSAPKALFAATPARMVHVDVALEQPRTNAARMARGLPPLPPQRRYTSTRVRRAAASPSPVISGRLAVYKDGTFRGYLAAAATPSVVASSASAALFQYTAPADAGSSVSIQSGPTGKYLAIGSVTGQVSLLSSTSANSARFLFATVNTPAGSIATRDSATSAQYDETTIFVVDPITMNVAVQWFNYDHSQPATPAVVQQDAYLYLTGSAAKFITIASGAMQVTLQFEPITS